MNALTLYQELTKSLSMAPLQSFYVFTGKEEWYVSAASQAVIKRAFEGQDPALMSFNLVELDGEEVSLSRVRQEIQTPPFFAGRKVVRVRQAKFLKSLKAQEGEDTKQPLTVTARDVVLICETESMSAKTGLIKGQNPYVLNFSFARRQDAILAAQAVVREELATYAMRIESPALNALLELLGISEKEPFVRALVHETRKVAAYKNFKGSINELDVRTLVSRSGEAKLWDVTDAITAKNSAKALKSMLEVMADGEEPLAILGGLASFFRQLLLARDYYDEGLPLEEAVKNLSVLSVHRFVAEKAYRAAPGFSRHQLSQWLTTCFTISQAIKSGKTNPLLALELLVVEASTRASAAQ